MDDVVPLPGSKEEIAPQPKKAAQAVVRCQGFRCTAYQDKNGVWRSVADDAELEVLEVVFRF
jgi:hypothetical protein